ncbi:MAG: response regulator [Candidatus Limnocylindrales bacterium]
MERIAILIAEDHAVVREGTRQILEHDPAFLIVAEADDGPSVLALAAELQPDLVLLDLNLPIINGIEVTKQLRASPQPPRVLILSAYDDEDYVMAALSAGASGYLLKTAHASEVIAAIHAVTRGEVVLDASVASIVLARARQEQPLASMLTERELQVLQLVSRGSRTKEIAADLSVSTRTVEAHITSIFNKLGVSSRTEAVLRASSKGWITLHREQLA